MIRIACESLPRPVVPALDPGLHPGSRANGTPITSYSYGSADAIIYRPDPVTCRNPPTVYADGGYAPYADGIIHGLKTLGQDALVNCKSRGP